MLWYPQLVPYGIPLDSRTVRTKTDFAVWTSATFDSNTTLRDLFINGIYDFLVSGSTGQAFPDLYDASNATASAFVNRPVIGGVYAHLAKYALSGSSRTANATLAGGASSFDPKLTSLGRRESVPFGWAWSSAAFVLLASSRYLISR